MTSGIYKLTFSNNQFYIGKSNDIERRWKEHKDSMLLGEAAAKMQKCYNAYGFPTGEILLECHPDHIDLMETYYINDTWSPEILNTAKPTPSCASDLNKLFAIENILLFSTAHHCDLLYKQNQIIEDLKEEVAQADEAYKNELQALKEGTLVEDLEIELEAEKDYAEKLAQLILEKNAEIVELKNKQQKKGFFSRLFNF